MFEQEGRLATGSATDGAPGHLLVCTTATDDSSMVGVRNLAEPRAPHANTHPTAGPPLTKDMPTGLRTRVNRTTGGGGTHQRPS